MPSNDERREVAAKLRKADLTEGASYMQEIEGFDSVTAVRFVMWPNLVSVLFGDKPIVSLQEIIDRLANLIEPEEQTCSNEAASNDYFTCSKCGMEVDLYNDYGGFSNYAHGDWNYCPNCDAKVVGE